MPHDEIPNMLGKVLSSTNYCLRQTRGKYGLGAKMALIWSKMSTSQPIKVESAQRGARFTSRYTLDIDIKRNSPIIVAEEKAPSAEQPWHGAEIVVTIKGNWKTYGHRVMSYFRQLAIITPYARLSFEYKALVRAAPRAGGWRGGARPTGGAVLTAALAAPRRSTRRACRARTSGGPRRCRPCRWRPSTTPRRWTSTCSANSPRTARPRACSRSS